MRTQQTQMQHVTALHTSHTPSETHFFPVMMMMHRMIGAESESAWFLSVLHTEHGSALLNLIRLNIILDPAQLGPQVGS